MNIKKIVGKSIAITILSGLLIFSLLVNIGYLVSDTNKEVGEIAECRQAFNLNHAYIAQMGNLLSKSFDTGDKCLAVLKAYNNGLSDNEKLSLAKEYTDAKNALDKSIQETTTAKASQSAELATFKYFLTELPPSIAE